MSVLNQINDSIESYQQLINLYHANEKKLFETVAVELRGWFSADMCAALGAILDKFTDDLNDLELTITSKPVETILSKNNFLSYYGFQKRYDDYHTTIEYLKLKPTDGKFFKTYVFNELLCRNELPKMSDLVRDKMAEAIYEIFVNAQIHSNTEHIYTCGQFFPRRNVICFTIADVGVGFKNKVNERFKSNLSAVQAISWAIMERSTTKRDITGGIGLAILKEFVVKNKGKMQIVSDDGFYEYGPGGENTHTFNAPFPGTIVNLQFRTDDNASYILKEEVDTSKIF